MNNIYIGDTKDIRDTKEIKDKKAIKDANNIKDIIGRKSWQPGNLVVRSF